MYKLFLAKQILTFLFSLGNSGGGFKIRSTAMSDLLTMIWFSIGNKISHRDDRRYKTIVVSINTDILFIKKISVNITFSKIWIQVFITNQFFKNMDPR